MPTQTSSSLSSFCQVLGKVTHAQGFTHPNSPPWQTAFTYSMGFQTPPQHLQGHAQSSLCVSRVCHNLPALTDEAHLVHFSVKSVYPFLAIPVGSTEWACGRARCSFLLNKTGRHLGMWVSGNMPYNKPSRGDRACSLVVQTQT